MSNNMDWDFSRPITLPVESTHTSAVVGTVDFCVTRGVFVTSVAPLVRLGLATGVDRCFRSGEMIGLVCPKILIVAAESATANVSFLSVPVLAKRVVANRP